MNGNTIKTTSLSITDKEVTVQNQSIGEIDASQAYQHFRNKNYIWLDMRPENEQGMGTISGAQSGFYYSSDFELIRKIGGLDRNENYIIFSSTGGFNSKSLAIFRNAAFKNVKAIKGGFNEWKKRNYPVVDSGNNGGTKPSPGFPSSGVYSLDTSDAVKYIKSNEIVWLDLRKSKTPSINFINNLNSSINSNNDFFLKMKIYQLDKSKHYIFFTDKGSRNSHIRKIFSEFGFKNANSVRGGYRSLKEEIGNPTPRQ